MTDPHFFKFRTVAVALALTLLLALPAALSAEVTSRDLTVGVGGARIHLLNPSGMIRVDGSGPEADRLLTIFKDQDEDDRTLAFYAEPKTWENFKKAVSRPGSGADLDYFAFIMVPSNYIDKSVSLEDFQAWLARVSAADKFKDCEKGERFITCRLNMGEDGLLAVMTHILVEGKFLALGTFSGPQNQLADQFIPSALEWRDAYLEITKPTKERILR